MDVNTEMTLLSGSVIEIQESVPVIIPYYGNRLLLDERFIQIPVLPDCISIDILTLCQYCSPLRVSRIVQPECTGISSSRIDVVIPLSIRLGVKHMNLIIKSIGLDTFASQPNDIEFVSPAGGYEPNEPYLLLLMLF